MSAVTCTINALYDIICRDADTAADGLDPENTVLHAAGFYRHFGDRIDELPGDGLDRKVQITYDGVVEWLPISTSISTLSNRMRVFGFTIRIGYFAGSHVDETMIVMGEDDMMIQNAMARSANWPDNCSSGCINGILPGESKVKELDPTRYVLEISGTAQVTG